MYTCMPMPNPMSPNASGPRRMRTCAVCTNLLRFGIDEVVHGVPLAGRRYFLTSHIHYEHSARPPLLPCAPSHPAPPHHLLHALHLSSPASLLPSCMCMQVYENGCTHVCTCVHVCASMSACISWCLAMCACMWECTFVCGFVCSTGQPTSVSEDVYIRICPRISLYLCLSFAGLLPI